MTAAKYWQKTLERLVAQIQKRSHDRPSSLLVSWGVHKYAQGIPDDFSFVGQTRSIVFAGEICRRERNGWFFQQPDDWSPIHFAIVRDVEQGATDIIDSLGLRSMFPPPPFAAATPCAFDIINDVYRGYFHFSEAKCRILSLHPSAYTPEPRIFKIAEVIGALLESTNPPRFDEFLLDEH